MKIALLHYAVPPVVGGVESVIGHHARLMADDGHAVVLVAGRGGQVDPRIPFVSLPQVDSRHPEVLALKAELDAGRVPDRLGALADAIAADLAACLSGFDVLIAHNVCSLNKNLALTAALKKLASLAGAPRLVLWHHDLAWTTPRYRSELHDGYPWDLLRTDWPEAVQVTISEARRQELAELLKVPAGRIQVVPNGVDAALFLKLDAQTQELASGQALLDAHPLLLLPVRITPRKNIELALGALAALRRTFPEAKLVVTGPLGPHNPANTAYFERLLAMRSELGLNAAAVFLAEHAKEYLPDAVIADFYRLADALLLPSREEGFGIPILEAGLAGLPVFCADIPTLKDLGEGFASYFSPDADPQMVAALIAGRLGADLNFGLRSKVKHTYTWQRIYREKIRPIVGQ